MGLAQRLFEPAGERVTAVLLGIHRLFEDRFTAPGFFGEQGLMTGEPRNATIVAKTDVECYRLDKETFEKIVAERPEAATEVADVLAKRRVELEAVRDHLDAAARQSRLAAEKSKLLATIQRFFGLDEERSSTTSNPPR